jgi:hypothetical protein
MSQDTFGNMIPFRNFNDPVNVILLAMDIVTFTLLLASCANVLADKKRPLRTKIIVGVAALGCCLSIALDVLFRYAPWTPPIVGWLNQFVAFVSVVLVV